MDPATTVAREVELNLDTLRLSLADLPRMADEWGTLPEGERASWSLDWDQLMVTRLQLLERRCRAGDMADEQRARYQQLLHQLAVALPVIERLDLCRPTVLPGAGTIPRSGSAA